MPRAIDNPTTVVFLKSIGAVVMSLIPVIAIDANTETVAPPSTQYGIVVSTEENFGINPAIRIIIAEVSNTLFATTFVEPTIPTFWLYVAVGSPPKNAQTILLNPYPTIPLHLSAYGQVRQLLLRKNLRLPEWN
jgi:hypothetical protein